MKVEIGKYPDDDSIHQERIVDVRIDRHDTRDNASYYCQTMCRKYGSAHKIIKKIVA